MGQISVVESITLDGVMQGLGRSDEDQRHGFAHGGWGDGYQDQVQLEFMSEGMASPGAMLFGRRTYEDVLGHWTSLAEPNPFSEHLTRTQKYVVSRSASTTLAFARSTLVTGDVVAQVARLKDETDLSIIGSGELVRTLHAAGLVDTYTLQIHPIVLGSGTRLFADGDRTDLTLERSVTTTTGVVIAQYAVDHS